MSTLESMRGWDGVAAGAVVFADGSIERVGDPHRIFELASLTKLYTAMAVLVAHEEGTLDLDEELSAGVTTADLLAHSAGVAPEERRWVAVPGSRRVYSTAAYDMIAEEISTRAAMPFAAYAHEAVAAPLGMAGIELVGSAGADATGSVDDMVRLASAWHRPTLIDPATHRRATTPHRPALAGVLPGYGRQDPNPWGLGVEIRGEKTPHWTGATNSPDTWGHFGRAGTFLWWDPAARDGQGLGLVVLTDRDFGPWAAAAWPPLADAVLATHH